MMRKSCPTTLTARHLFSALLLLGALGTLTVVTTACEDKAIGRQCDVEADAGTQQAVFNGQALECPTRICVKPAVQQGVPDNKGTAAYCTAECSKDSECDGETRDSTSPNDKRCTKGFVCAVAFEVGPLCCKKLCMCKDFIPATGLPTPASCDKSKGTSTCQNL
jgi:hypothetical protein